MTRKYRKPPCYGKAYGEDCRFCKYKEECKNIIENLKIIQLVEQRRINKCD